MEEHPFDAEAIAKIHAKAMRLCSQREKSEFDMELWYAGKGVPQEYVSILVARLVEQNFVDNARYAESYAREKMRLSGWGPLKVEMQLRAKRIDGELIRSAIEQAREELGGGDLEAQLDRKLAGGLRRYLDDPSLRERMLRFAVGRGFSFEEALRAVDAVMRRQRRE